jgi:hypothetical protein
MLRHLGMMRKKTARFAQVAKSPKGDFRVGGDAFHRPAEM